MLYLWGCGQKFFPYRLALFVQSVFQMHCFWYEVLVLLAYFGRANYMELEWMVWAQNACKCYMSLKKIVFKTSAHIRKWHFCTKFFFPYMGPKLKDGEVISNKNKPFRVPLTLRICTCWKHNDSKTVTYVPNKRTSDQVRCRICPSLCWCNMRHLVSTPSCSQLHTWCRHCGREDNL